MRTVKVFIIAKRTLWRRRAVGNGFIDLDRNFFIQDLGSWWFLLDFLFLIFRLFRILEWKVRDDKMNLLKHQKRLELVGFRCETKSPKTLHVGANCVLKIRFGNSEKTLVLSSEFLTLFNLGIFNTSPTKFPPAKGLQDPTSSACGLRVSGVLHLIL